MIEEKEKRPEGREMQADSVTELARKAIRAGYRVVPIKDGAPTGGFKDGQTYTNTRDWVGATAVGLILDQAVLLDYDGNKADEAGEWIIPIGELPKKLGLDIMPTPVQSGSAGRSLHYLFRLPDGVRGGVDIKSSADGKLLDHVDIKCGNQLMHLKVGKQLGEIKPVAQLPLVPDVLLEALTDKRGDGSYDEALANLMRGTPLHHSARTVVNRMIQRECSDEEIWTLFAGLRPALEMVRDKERIAELFNRGLPDLIKSGRAKFPPAEVPFEVEAVDGSDWLEWVYIGHDDAFYNRGKRLSLTRSAFNSYMSREDRRVLIGDKVKVLPADKYALEHAGIPIVAFSMYAPQFGDFFTYKGADCFNSYQAGFAPAAVTPWTRIFEDHIKLLFPKDHKVITQWMAYVVCNVGRKVLWSPLLKGIEGDGKTAIGNMIIAALGQENARQIDMDSLRSSFNAWAEGACVGVIEEVRVSGQNRHLVMDKLKPLITNSEISVTRKGQDPFTALNTMNYLLLTNHEDALAISETDRRYGVFFTQFTERSQLPDVDAYYAPLWDAIRTRGGEIRAWLESIDLSDFNPNSAPDSTEAKRKMVLNSRSEATELLAEVLELGGLGVHPETFNPTAVNLLIEEYRLGRPLNNRQLPRAAAELGFERAAKFRWHGKTCQPYVKIGSDLAHSSDAVKGLWEEKSHFEPE